MWEVVGHEEAVALLSKSLEKDMLSHAYLFVGPPQVGKTTLAMNLAQGVNCLESPPERPCSECTQCRRIATRQHPDVQVIDLVANSDGSAIRREIGINQVRDVQHSATLKPYEGKYRVFIFQEASSLSSEASNALLKLLEEPPESVLIILLTSDIESIFPTIVSRCQWVGLNYVALSTIGRELQNTLGTSQQEAMNLARLSKGRIGWALEAAGESQLMDDYSTELERVASLLDETLEGRFAYAEEMATLYARNREKAVEQLKTAVSWWRDLLVLKKGRGEYVANMPSMEALQYHAGWISTPQVMEAIKRIRDTIGYMETNVNPRLALEVLMLSLPRREDQLRPEASRLR
jgi:DNA polymerase-3 subunit delta'